MVAVMNTDVTDNIEKPNPIKNRIDLVAFFAAINCNHQGDVDADNYPRVDPHTGHAEMSVGGFRYWLRRFANHKYGTQHGMRYWVKPRSVLSDTVESAYNALGLVPTEKSKKGKARGSTEQQGQVSDYLCRNYWDMRAFGGFASIGMGARNAQGPVHCTEPRTVDPVDIVSRTVTRQARHEQKEQEYKSDEGGEMGRNVKIAFGMFKVRCGVSPALAEQTGFSRQDYDIMIEALKLSFANFKSSSKDFSIVKIVEFEHDSPYGSGESPEQLYERVQAKKLVDHPRSIGDYSITINRDNLPPGIKMTVIL